MKHSEARDILCLDKAMPTLTVEIVQEAFRNACKAYHPDTGILTRLEGMVPVYTMDQLTKARKTLLDNLNGADFACGSCGGSGKVRGKVGLSKCPTCKGTGDKR